MIYLDNAATSFPKPSETIEAAKDFMENIGGNPGRSGHDLSLKAARIIFEAREGLTTFIGGKDSERLIFTQNGTEALNLAILGLLKMGDHVVTTSMEHNSVMRPLTYLQKERGVTYAQAQCTSSGLVDVDNLKSLIRNETKAVIINHGSNVTGTVQSLAEVRQAIGDKLLILDACQSVGSYPVDVEKDGIDIICFSCHKALLGIQGVGALYMRKDMVMIPLRFGGTGSKSESIDPPQILPDRYECGTPNTPGIAALLGGLSFIEKTGLEKIISRKNLLRKKILKGLLGIDGVRVYGITDDHFPVVPILSFNVEKKMPSDVGQILNREGIYTRVGLHCSPVAHKTIGSYPQGSVRAAPGYFTKDEDIDRFLEVVRTIARQ